jgi:protein-S-isoprenylcysteine O-methyltransferase Ste14
MNTTDSSKQKQPQKARVLPLWQACPLALFVWGVLPWAISLLTPHYGWAVGRPGTWNLLGLIPVVVGAAGLFWGMSAHTIHFPKLGIDWEPDKSYLLRNGLYAYSRNPMYVAELILMLGWVIFYGSIAVLIALLAWYVLFNYYQIPLEERILEAHFGDVYREYKSEVPRWLGNVRD